MWNQIGKQIDSSFLGNLMPKEVLFEFEEPLSYVALDSIGQPLLLHNLASTDDRSHYLVVVTTERIITELKKGHLDVLGALRQPRCWLADIGPMWNVIRLASVDFSELPETALPRPGAMLTPHLDPIFRVRLLGEGVGPGRTSATDVRVAAQAAELSLKRLADIALKRRKATGRPTRQFRRYFDLPVQYLGAASFEITFASPKGEPQLFSDDDEVFHEMGRLLEAGLQLIRNDKADAAVLGLNPEEAIQLAEAIKALTPSTQGDVDRIEIGGRLLDEWRTTTILTRDDRRSSIMRTKQSRLGTKKEKPFLVSGLINEADQSEFTFTLRELDPSIPDNPETSEIRFHFGDHLFDNVIDAFNSLDRVVIIGQRAGQVYEALDIKYASEVSDGTEASPAKD